MNGAFEWIGFIAEWLGKFIPRWVIVETTQRGVKFRGGDDPVLCEPGIVWYWPIRSSIEFHSVVRQTDRLETQTMESKDGITFIVGATITYTIPNLMVLVTTTHSPLTAVIDIAMSAIHDVCCDFDWKELQDVQRRGTLKTKLKNEAQKQLKDFGVEVMKLQLNTLARARVIKVAQSTSVEEN